MEAREVIEKVHAEAQECLREAQLWKAIGDEAKTLFYCDQAYRLGRIVMDAIIDELDPASYGKLHVNLATLALTTGRHSEAIFLARRGLEQDVEHVTRSQLDGVIHSAEEEIRKIFVL